jgi:hypothetical protein
MHAQGQTAPEQQSNQAHLQQMQHEIEMLRVESQTDRIRLQTELMQLQMDRDGGKEPRQKSAFEVMAEYQAQKAAEEAAAQAEAERVETAAIASAHSANLLYLGVAVALPAAFGFLIARRAKAKGGNMKHEEKFGVLLMIGALLMALLALSISENWVPRYDALQNLMLTLKIRLFPDGELSYSTAMIDIYTKHVLLGLVTVAAYGFTTYLGITPAWKKHSPAPSQSIEPPRET